MGFHIWKLEPLPTKVAWFLIFANLSNSLGKHILPSLSNGNLYESDKIEVVISFLLSEKKSNTLPNIEKNDNANTLLWWCWHRWTQLWNYLENGDVQKTQFPSHNIDDICLAVVDC